MRLKPGTRVRYSRQMVSGSAFNKIELIGFDAIIVQDMDSGFYLLRDNNAWITGVEHPMHEDHFIVLNEPNQLLKDLL